MKKHPAGGNPWHLRAADLDGDGAPDAAYGKFDTQAVSDMAVVLGNGDGTLYTALDSAPPSIVADLVPAPDTSIGASSASGDFNGDGIPDLASLGYFFNEVTIRSGDGRGGYDDEATFGCGFAPADITVQDFDGDGIDDLRILVLEPGPGIFLVPAVRYMINGLGE